MFQCWEAIRAENTCIQDETSVEQSVTLEFQIRLQTEKLTYVSETKEEENNKELTVNISWKENRTDLQAMCVKWEKNAIYSSQQTKKMPLSSPILQVSTLWESFIAVFPFVLMFYLVTCLVDILTG